MSAAALLAGVHVAELAGPFGDACARLLGSLGAGVTTLTRCSGLPAEAARAGLCELLQTSDVLIESEGLAGMSAAGLGPERLQREFPRLIHASITAFGGSGPHAHLRGGELVSAAMGGVLRLCGEPDRPPVKEALDACSFHAQAAAAAAIMLAYHERLRSGLGQHLDISVQEVAASRLTNAVLLWQFDRKLLERSGQALRYGRAAVRCLWPLRDGYVFHSLMSGRFGAAANAALSAWMDELGCDNPLRGVDWLAYDRSALPGEVRGAWEAALERFFRGRSKHEIAEEGQRRGINAAVVQEPSDVLADPQLAARDFWTTRQREGRALRVPGRFMQITPGVGPQRDVVVETSIHGSPSRALAGVRVLDLSWALVGSLTTKALGDHGACVVKLESSQRPCLSRLDVQVARSTRSSLDDKPWFAHLNSSKLSIALDLKHARAAEVLEPLIEWADVIVENFSPGTLDKLGLGYARLSRRRPELILLSASAYGQTGPRAQGWGVDGTAGALSARTWLTGWPDRGPVLPSAVPYADAVVPHFMVAALGAALAKRRQTGQGCHVDISMYEISVQQMQQALIEQQLGQPLERSGNRERTVWHQGVYPARGHDRFVAVSLFDRGDYQRLTELLGGVWPAFEDFERACDTRELFDRQLSSYTCMLEDYALMHSLQAAGIAAGVVQDASDLLERDPQLRARPAWQLLGHPLLGEFEHQTTPYRLARTPGSLAPAPLLGEHTERVCRELLGLSAEHYLSLAGAGLFR